MFSTDDIETMRNGKLVDTHGDKVGKVGEIFLDDQTGEPAWATVNTSFFGTAESFVPLKGATREGDDLQVRFDKQQIKDAPRVDGGEHLDAEHEQELYRYYGLDYGGTTDSNAVGERDDNAVGERDDNAAGERAGGDAISGQPAGERQDGTQGGQDGRRLRKYVVTEETRVVSREPVEEVDGPGAGDQGSAGSGSHG